MEEFSTRLRCSRNLEFRADVAGICGGNQRSFNCKLDSGEIPIRNLASIQVFNPESVLNATGGGTNIRLDHIQAKIAENGGQTGQETCEKWGATGMVAGGERIGMMVVGGI